MKKYKVIITSAGAGPAVAAIKALTAQKEIPLEVIGMDMDKTAAGLYLADSFTISPHVTDNSFIDYVLNYVQSKKVDFIIPIFDIETPVFTQAREFIQEKAPVRILVNDHEVITRCNQKRQTADYCQAHGIPVPHIYSHDEIMQKNVRYPAILKPASGIGSKDMRMIESEQELEKAVKLSNDYILQDFIPGPEYTIDTFSDFATNCLAAVPRERIVVKAGQSVKGRTITDNRLIAYGKSTAQVFGLIGVGCIQCKVHNDSPYLIEVNPRYGTGLSLSVAAGVNLPLLHLKLALGKHISEQELHFKELYMSRYWEEIYLDKDNI